MQARVIVQTNRVTGQKNVTFTGDRLAPIEDFLVNWEDSEVLSGTVLLLGLSNDILVEKLLDTELHSVFQGGIECVLDPDTATKYRDLLEGVTHGNSRESC